MKLSTWQLVAVLAILIGGIIAANVWAPGAVAVVTGMATTIFAALFVTHDNGPKDPPGPPALTVISGGAAALVAIFCAFTLSACGASFDDLEKAAAQGDNASKLALCRADARSAFYVEGKTEDEAMARYDACAKKASQ